MFERISFKWKMKCWIDWWNTLFGVILIIKSIVWLWRKQFLSYKIISSLSLHAYKHILFLTTGLICRIFNPTCFAFYFTRFIFRDLQDVFWRLEFPFYIFLLACPDTKKPKNIGIRIRRSGLVIIFTAMVKQPPWAIGQMHFLNVKRKISLINILQSLKAA